MSAAHTPGPWLIATSNSWRRFVAQDMTPVCEPVTQNDGHPDLYFRNGGADGPDASLIACAPELLDALIRMCRSYDRVRQPGAPKPDSQKYAEVVIAKATGSAA